MQIGDEKMDFLNQVLILDKDIHSLHMRCSFKLLGHDIHPGQPPILKVIKELGNCNQCDIAKFLDTSPASVGVSIRRLEKCGLVKKEQDKNDTRSNSITLTEKGLDASNKAEDALKILTEKKLKGFSDEEIQEYISFLKRIYKNIQDYQDELYERT